MTESDTIEQARHQVAIWGVVSSAQSQAALPGLFVTIIEGPSEFMDRVDVLKTLSNAEKWARMPERPDRTTTGREGRYHFLDLPDGNYKVKASFPLRTRRYASVEAASSVTSISNKGREIAPARLDLQLPATTIEGQVTRSDDGVAVAMAEVRLTGSGERAFSNVRGDYRLIGIEYGERKLVATAEGYDVSAATVTIASEGSTEQLDILMSPQTA